MVDIPENEVSVAELQSWYEMHEQLRKLRAAEITLRKRLFEGFFPEPKEGTNNFPLEDSYVLKGQYKLDRKVDESAFTAMKDKLREVGVTPEKIVRYKPELAVGEYRKLSDEQRNIVDQFLIIKPGSPSMEIVLPKKAQS